MAKLDGDKVPMLDGKPVQRTKKGFSHADGTPVDKTRERDIVFVALGGGAQSALDLADVLAGIAPPSMDEEVDAGFFHRTLARFLGLPEGRQPDAARGTDAVLWDYALWKAELHDDGGPPARRLFRAVLFRAVDEPPQTVRYWVALDGKQRITGAGWIDDAPRLWLDDDAAASTADLSRMPTDPDLLRRLPQLLFDDDDDDTAGAP